MYKSTLPLVLFALLLAACNLQTTVEPPTPTLPTALPVVILATQPGGQPIQTPLPLPQPAVPLPNIPVSGGILYFWPVSLSPDLKLNGARSSSSDGGYIIEFDNAQTGSSIDLRAGAEADRYPYCAGNTNPYQIRGMEGCYSMGTGAGAALAWRENGIHYSVGGIGNSLEFVVQFANNLEVLDYQTWQQKFSNAANVSPAGGGLLYFWPVSVPAGMKLNGARSSFGAGGYTIEFGNAQTGSALVLRAGTEADRYPYCAGQTNPYQIRSVEGCYSLGTGAGASLEWKENGVHYSVGGMGNSLEAVVQFANNLQVLDYQTWQQKFANAARM